MSSTSRRAHHKSRGGCTTCKSKKVKCDEQHPCSYCVKRHLQCSLTPSPSPGTSGDANTPPEVTVFRPYEEPSFTFTDFGLYRHYIKATALAQADDSASVTVWRETIPDLATQHAYLLHEVLAVAAQHARASAPPEQAGFYERAAAEHQARAIPLFREALAASSAETAVALFACSCLFVPYHFAAARDASSLLFGEAAGALPEWLVLIHGCAAVTMEHGDTVARSPLRALLGDLTNPRPEELCHGPTDARLRRLAEDLPAEDVSASPERADAYAQAVAKLRLSFYLSDRADSPLNRKNAALRFPVFMNQPRIAADLAAGRPAALVLMAFWCVLMHRVQDRWWLKDKVGPLLRKIEELVPPQYKHLLAWPLEQVGI